MGRRTPILTLDTFFTVCSDSELEWSINDFQKDVFNRQSNLGAFLRSEVTDVTCYHSEVGVSHEYLIMRIRPRAEDHAKLGSLIHLRCERHPGPVQNTGLFALFKERPPAKDTIRLQHSIVPLMGDQTALLISQTFHEGLQVAHVVDLLASIHQEQPQYGLFSYNCWWFAAVSITTLRIFGVWTQPPASSWAKKMVKGIGEKTADASNKITTKFIEKWDTGDGIKEWHMSGVRNEISAQTELQASLSNSLSRPIKRYNETPPPAPAPLNKPKFVSTGDRKITLLWRPDVSRLRVSALVNPARADLLYSHNNSLNSVIHAAAGPSLEEECKNFNGASAGQSKITKGYKLQASHVIHTVGPFYDWRNPEPAREKLASCYKSSLSLAAEHDLHDIAFPCISTGNNKFPLQEATSLALFTIKEFLKTNPGKKIRHVVFLAFSQDELSLLKSELPRYFPQAVLGV